MGSEIMRIEETAMAPYLGLLRNMTREEKIIVVSFLIDTLDESHKSKKEIIQEKYKNLKTSPEIKKLRGCIKLTEEDLLDERINYVLNR